MKWLVNLQAVENYLDLVPVAPPDIDGGRLVTAGGAGQPDDGPLQVISELGYAVQGIC